ncbi:MAG: CAP domain-containing protein [Labilithrix sp.]|nr:CAP domain-containing protein [Labilithrix sp.]MCW5818127.1 CAP domain-containing protein [Labilithrix sp.]
MLAATRALATAEHREHGGHAHVLATCGHRARALVVGVVAAWLVGCAAEPVPVTPRGGASLAPIGDVPAPASSWRDVTESPQEAAPPADPRVAAIAKSCRTLDAALMRVAESVVADGADVDVERVTLLLRENGAPYVRPRVLIGASIEKALQSLHGASTRCGIATATATAAAATTASAPPTTTAAAATTGTRELAIVADALADLEPLPVRSRTGAWLDFRARVNVPAKGARVVLLGARGAPRTVATAFDATSGSARARFALDRPGPFTVQLVADLEEGPRPVLEARVFADVAPSHASDVAPGEDAANDDVTGGDVTGKGAFDDATSLERMIAAVRANESLGPLQRDPRLDAIARRHVEGLARVRAVAHDLGDGDPRARFEAENLHAGVMGENVARGRTLALAHRAIHASPSHRLNLLNAKYTHLGVAVARDADGRVYVCEVFSSPL